MAHRVGDARPYDIDLLLANRAYKEPVTLLIMGQSTEQGPVLLGDKAAWPIAFAPERNPEFMQKRLIPNPNRGGWAPKVYDELWDWGYDLDIINGACGGASLLDHIIGTNNVRASNYPYYMERPASGFPDLGDTGQIVSFGGKTFKVKQARKRQAWNDGPFPGVVGSSVQQDFVAFEQIAGNTAAVAPDVSNVQVGQDVVDGAVTFTAINGALYLDDGQFLPGHDGSPPNLVWANTFGERSYGRGFDPLGILAHSLRLANQARPSRRKIVWFSQGQSDLGGVVNGYLRPVQILANFYLRRGWTVILGNTVFSPASQGSTAAAYGVQAEAVNQAVANLNAYYPGKIFRGANLHDVLGRTGRMGGMRVTGAITGGNLLTITATGSGSEIVAGQRVFDGQSVVGTVASIGTYNGVAGTVNLVGGATNVASRQLICVGSGLQFDGIHFNGSVVADLGVAVAGSIKAVLPELRI